MTRLVWLVCLLPLGLMAGSQDDLTLRRIMDDPIWIGETPTNIKISPDKHWIYFEVPRAIPLPSKWMKMSVTDLTVSELDGDHRIDALTGQSYQNGQVRIDEIDGDLWIATPGERATPLISRGARVAFVRFLGEKGFIFREGNELYHFNMITGSVIQVSNLAIGKDEPKDEETFYSDEEKKLFTHVENQYVREDYNKEHESEERQFGSLRKPDTAYLGSGYGLGGLWFPDENRHAIDITRDMDFITVTLEPEDEGKPTQYAQFVNKEGELVVGKARPRVTNRTKTWKLAVVTPEDGAVKWLDVSGLPEIKTDRLSEIKEALDEDDKKHLPKQPEEDTPRPLMLVPRGLNGHSLLVTAFSLDYKDRWIFTVDVRTMEVNLVHHHHDPAWVQYVTRGMSEAPHFMAASASWSRSGGEIVFLSDESGYQHLYSYDVARKTLKQLTKGNYEVLNPFEGPVGRYWYLHANKVHPGEYHYYRLPKNGGELEQLTDGEGYHQVTMSRDGKLMVDHYGRTNQPPVLRISRDGEKWQEVYDGRADEFKQIDWVKPEIVTYKNRDGKDVYARLYKPEKSNGAGVVFVHGAGYLQNAHKGWSGYFREYMYHNLLLRKGYTVLDPDYQASAGYGRDWRTAIYRHMGGKDLDDVIDGAEYLVKEHGIQAKRLGVYGGSYGGFITFMAMFNSPQTFQSGAALRPVSDWAHYNQWYVGRILNNPLVDPVAYRQSSPIYFAEGLEGHLLICHGMVDDNVQYIDSVRLAQRLIELRKDKWESASYPVEPHGFKSPTSWYDEYRRITELFERTLK